MASALSLRSLPYVAALAAGLIAVAGPATAMSDIELVARWAGTHAVPVRTVEMAGSTADLAPLATMVGDARVVAFGEPTHGAREPLAFGNRLFRYLVEELGFTAIVLETSLTESRRLHDCVLGGPGEVGDVVREGMSWGFGDYQDNVDLVRWIRAWNADPSHTRKVHIYGMDVAVTLEFKPRRAPLDQALAYVEAADPEAGAAWRARLQPYMDRFAEGNLTLTPSEHDALTAAIDDLIAAVERSRPDAVAEMDPADFDWIHRITIAARQSDRVFRATRADPVDGARPDDGPPFSARDAAMAENVAWALAREGPGGRVLVFAHCSSRVGNGRTRAVRRPKSRRADKESRRSGKARGATRPIFEKVTARPPTRGDDHACPDRRHSGRYPLARGPAAALRCRARRTRALRACDPARLGDRDAGGAVGAGGTDGGGRSCERADRIASLPEIHRGHGRFRRARVDERRAIPRDPFTRRAPRGTTRTNP